MQQGGSPYGAPPTTSSQAELTPFHHHVQTAPEAAPPISTRPPHTAGVGAAPPVSNYEELGAMGDDALEGGSGGLSGNRWPRQETLALLKIRSDMDAVFRDATLKGPLWEEVSRKLAELGFRRNAKKCKEKFENVHKYYKRTKEGRAGRQDGKSYRFFDQLEALHNTTPGSAAPSASPVGSAINSPSFLMSTTPPAAVTIAPPNAVPVQTPRIQPMQISALTPITAAPQPAPPAQPTLQAVMAAHQHPSASTVAAAVGAAGISFSSNTSSSLGGSESEDYDDDEATQEGPSSSRKRKREGGSSGGGSGKMMAFFEGLMRQVMERQEAMQQRFLEAIEKREQDRMIREEAWRRQEMSRTAREHELATQERSASAARDAAIISFLQKLPGQPAPLPPPPAIQTPPPAAPPPQVQVQQPPPQQQQQQLQHLQNTEIVRPPPTSTELVPVRHVEPHEGAMVMSSSGISFSDPASSRWPKSEVHALIKLRSNLDSRYQETGPKGPLWEEISAGMQRLGYSRSAKRCKEKWENINKYFKKVKESNKRRPEDGKTCPYFHQLDALYRSKQVGGGSSARPASAHNVSPNANSNPAPLSMIAPPLPPQVPQQQQHREVENKNGTNTEPSGGPAPSNGGIGSPFFGQAACDSGGGVMKKPEDIVKELMGQSNEYGKLDEGGENDNMDDDDEGFDEEEEEDEEDEDGNGNGQFRIQFQRQNNVGPNAGGGGGGGGGAATTNNASGGKPASSGSSFLAMVR